jgi:hypothetical protein
MANTTSGDDNDNNDIGHDNDAASKWTLTSLKEYLTKQGHDVTTLW